jgi:hypothetical protein
MNEFYMLRDYRNSTSAINSLAVGAEGSKILLAYPNPFNSTCTIPYSSERTGEGGVSIYDSKGGLVKKLLEGRMNAGKNSVQWNGTDGRERKVSSGAYIIKIRTPDNKIESRKIIFVK